MKDDLISRKPLIDMLQGVEDDIFAEAMREVNPNKAFVAGVVQEVKNQVLALPGVDAVEVVRCKECQALEPCLAASDGYSWCNVWDTVVRMDGYCHLAEKKDAKDMDVPTKDGGADNGR